MRFSNIANSVNAPVIHNNFFRIFRLRGCNPRKEKRREEKRREEKRREEKRKEEKRREETRREEKLPRAAIINFGANPIREVLGAWGL